MVYMSYLSKMKLQIFKKLLMDKKLLPGSRHHLAAAEQSQLGRVAHFLVEPFLEHWPGMWLMKSYRKRTREGFVPCC